MALIELERVAKHFIMGGETLRALDEVSLSIQPGEFISIIGPSGCGKSTLLNILGLLDQPTQGSFRLDGKAVTSLTDDQRSEVRNSKIGFVFQSFNLLARATALRNVEMPLVYASEAGGKALSKELRIAKSVEALRRVGLAERMNHRPNELSGGQRQRVAIARAIVNRPKIIFADEPTGNLDSRSGLEILELFQDLNREGTTLIMVTHDPKIAARATRTISMLDGKVVEDRYAAH